MMSAIVTPLCLKRIEGLAHSWLRWQLVETIGPSGMTLLDEETLLFFGFYHINWLRKYADGHRRLYGCRWCQQSSQSG